MAMSSNDVIFVSMSGRDSAMWFSFTGLYHAFEQQGLECHFAFPSPNPSCENSYVSNVFFYSLKRPIKTFISVLRLARYINSNYSRVILFSQGVFSALLVLLLNRKIEVVSWGHEITNHINRAGFLRGLNYLLSDKVVAMKTSRMIVASDQLYTTAIALYPRKTIVKTCLPIAGDFSSLLDTFNISKDQRQRTKVNILFFGVINSYKGLDILGRATKYFNDDDIHITIFGRGPLDKYSSELYERSVNGRNVTWYNLFVTAGDVVDELRKTDFMYAMYSSVTATSQIDIANSFGVPVLVSNLPFFSEKVSDGINGFILDEESLIDFLRDCIHKKTNGISLIDSASVKQHQDMAGVNKACVNQLVSAGIL